MYVYVKELRVRVYVKGVVCMYVCPHRALTLSGVVKAGVTRCQAGQQL